MHGEGMLVSKCKGTEISENVIDKVGTMAAHYGNGLIVSDSSNILVKGNTITNAGFYGIQVCDKASGITLDGNKVSKSNGDGVNVSRGSSVVAQNNKFFDNGNSGKYSEGGNGIVFDGHETSYGNVSGTISNNECYSNKANGIYIVDASVTISGNNSHDNKESGIRVSGFGTNTISDNKLVNNVNHTGLHLLGTTVNTVSGNHIYKSSPDMSVVGIRLEEYAQANLSKNIISNYGQSAVYADTNTKVTMTGNEANLSGKTAFSSYTYFISNSKNSDAAFHNHLYLSEITTTSVKGQTFRSGCDSGAIVAGVMYPVKSDSSGVIYKTFPSNSGNVILFTVDSSGNSICLNAPVDYVYGAPSEEQKAQVKAFVNRLYLTTLGRSGEEDGLNFWTNHLLAGNLTGAQAANQIIFSEEFKNKNLTYNEFLDVMYAAFFDRPKDDEGYYFWLDQMYNGASQEYVVACFVDSDEFTGICESYGIIRGDLDKKKGAPTGSQGIVPLKVDSSNVNDAQLSGYVEKLYTTILGRASEPDGCAYWKQAIKEGKGMDAGKAASRFFQEKEYKDKNKSDEEFLLDVYAMFFGRNPIGTSDEEGYYFWLDHLKNGRVSRVWLIEKGFGQSDEFKGILEGYGFVIKN
jgi:parallel beta-helix repeat protein